MQKNQNQNSVQWGVYNRDNGRLVFGPAPLNRAGRERRRRGQGGFMLLQYRGAQVDVGPIPADYRPPHPETAPFESLAKPTGRFSPVSPPAFLASLPVAQAHEKIGALMAREDRKDFVFPLKDLGLTYDKTIKIREFRLEKSAFKQLLKAQGFWGRNAAEIILSGQAPASVKFVNSACLIADTNGTWNRDKRVMLRTRLNAKGERAVYAVVDASYPAHDLGDVSKVLFDLVTNPAAKMRLNYQPLTTEFAIEIHWPTKTVLTSVGDEFLGGLKVRSRDDGQGALIVTDRLTRLACSNGLVLTEEGARTRIVHRGSLGALKAKLRSHCMGTTDRAHAFFEDWETLKRTPMNVWSTRFSEGEEALKHLVKEGIISTKASDKVLVEMLLGSFREEPGTSLADLVNAVTRAAWQKTDDLLLRHQLEVEGGKLVKLFRAPLD